MGRRKKKGTAVAPEVIPSGQGEFLDEIRDSGPAYAHLSDDELRERLRWSIDALLKGRKRVSLVGIVDEFKSAQKKKVH